MCAWNFIVQQSQCSFSIKISNIFVLLRCIFNNAYNHIDWLIDMLMLWSNSIRRVRFKMHLCLCFSHSTKEPCNYSKYDIPAHYLNLVRISRHVPSSSAIMRLCNALLSFILTYAYLNSAFVFCSNYIILL